MNQTFHPDILKNSRTLIRQVEARLNGRGIAGNWPAPDNNDGIKGSAVLFLLTLKQTGYSREPELCLLLNKRSRKVLQPGDLCCPGGGVATADKVLSRFMHLPYCPLHRWARRERDENRQISRRIALLLTTGLREAWEEMRLNPLKVLFLGPLPVQQLIMFERKIYPLAAWVPAQLRLKPNWEVERIVHLPLRRLLDYRNYGRYRLTFKKFDGDVQRNGDFPCFIHRGGQGTEILWGATFRITLNFLSLVFGFSLPDLESLPVVMGECGKNYLNGSLWNRAVATQDEAHDH